MVPVIAGGYSAFMMDTLNRLPTARHERDLVLIGPSARERRPGRASTLAALSTGAPETPDRPPLSSALSARPGPPARPARKSAWRGFVEPVIFAVALVAAMLTMRQWFSQAVTQAEVPVLLPQVAVAPH